MPLLFTVTTGKSYTNIYRTCMQKIEQSSQVHMYALRGNIGYYSSRSGV